MTLLSQRRPVANCKLRSLVGIAVLLCASSSAWAGDPGSAARSLLTTKIAKGVVCGAELVDLSDGRVLCRVNEATPLLPASNEKLTVMAAAIDLLGPNFEFQTVLAMRGDDLVLIGDGDPALGDEKVAVILGLGNAFVFDEWASTLRAQSITHISGDLVVDASVFDAVYVHPDWESRDLLKPFAAPVAGLNYHQNCVDITVKPAKRVGDPVLWECSPSAEIIKLDNRCKTSSKKSNAIINRPGDEFRFVVTGRCAKPWPFPSVPVPDPVLLTASALRTALGKQGITIAGELRLEQLRMSDGALPANCKVVAEHRTPLAAVLARVGKDSENMFAEALMKRLGYEWSRRRGTETPVGSWQTGRAALRDFLARTGASVNRLVIADASGLSRKNRLTAADIVAVLTYMQKHEHRELFVQSLSEAGTDGTLRKRLKKLPGKVFAKTGYLSGVRTLSGYAITPSGQWRAFSVLFNGFKGPSKPYNDIHNQVCRILTSDPSGAAP